MADEQDLREGQGAHSGKPGREDQIRQYVVGPIQTNCYAYVSQGQCMVVDPGFAGDQIAQALADVDVRLIVCTHGHGDHVGGVSELKAATGAEFVMSAADVGIAQDMDGSGNHPGETKPPLPDRTVGEGDVLEVGTARFRVIETPGHTAGGIVLIGEGSAKGVAFVGDTLFAGSFGRTDLPTGSPVQMAHSLKRLAHEIDPSSMVLCGHGANTMMKRELEENPGLQS
ncbi:MAG: MBL fold metallo-hydrolase [Tractidigestivibacter sp.]|uniref:MBL fold metallo-hydrolase n=1 Tax=Tractidigestivibacter sp. TaxID=2847320 RepID=UPI003D94014E